MSEIADAIIFDTLEQFTHDPSAGAPLLDAVTAIIDDVGDGFAAAVSQKEAARSFRWLGNQPEKVQIQVIALAGTVRKYNAHHGGRLEMKHEPSRVRLHNLEKAIYLYRLLQKKKTAAAVVEKTPINTRAAYKAITRINYAIIKQMRESGKPWPMISAALESMHKKKISPQLLSELYGEVVQEQAERANLPRVMSHYENEETPKETIEAYKKAGYSGIEPPQQTTEERECLPCSTESSAF